MVVTRPRYRVIAATRSFTTICGDHLHRRVRRWPATSPTTNPPAHMYAVVEAILVRCRLRRMLPPAQLAGYAVEFTLAEITNLGSRLLPIWIRMGR